jgi:Na+-transporting NADH:ubiquinone oxidoreductase subunit NqrD
MSEESGVPGGSEPKPSSYRPILITLLCALLLGGGSCFGFLTTLQTLQGSNSSINSIFGLGFIGSLFVFFGAVIWFIVTWLKRRLN